MSGQFTSALLQAGHYRQLAMWTSDDRTHTILLDMARELEAGAASDLARPQEIHFEGLARALS